MPSQNQDPVLYDKLHDLLQLCEVVYQTTQGTHSAAISRNSMSSGLTGKDFAHQPQQLISNLDILLKDKFAYKLD